MNIEHLALRFGQRAALNPELRWYALVDGLVHHAIHETWLTPAGNAFALFTGTDDEPLAHAGPWLLEISSPSDSQLSRLARLEEAHGVSWIYAEQPMHGLAQLLQLYLDVQLPDGRQSLLRFWDPRVLYQLTQVLSEEQLRAFCGLIDEWHFLHEGKPVWIGRPDAHTR